MRQDFRWQKVLEDLPGAIPSPALQQDSTDERRGPGRCEKFGEKAETKMKPHLEQSLQHTQLPHSQECEVWGWEGVGERHQDFLNKTLTEKEAEARCPDFLGGFCWVLQILLGQGAPGGSSLQGWQEPPGIPTNPACSSKDELSSFSAQGGTAPGRHYIICFPGSFFFFFLLGKPTHFGAVGSGSRRK